MKTYLHKSIKILQFLSGGKIQKCLSSVAYITRDFLTCYSCSYYSSILKDMPNSIEFYKKIFLHVIHAHNIVPCTQY